jgi:hypothetical protein
MVQNWLAKRSNSMGRVGEKVQIERQEPDMAVLPYFHQQRLRLEPGILL